MKRPYSLSEDEFHKLQRAQESIDLMSILFSEVQRDSHYTPQMISSLLEMLNGEVSLVINSIIVERKQQCAG